MNYLVEGLTTPLLTTGAPLLACQPTGSEKPKPICAAGESDPPSVDAPCPSCCYGGRHCPKHCDLGMPF